VKPEKSMDINWEAPPGGVAGITAIEGRGVLVTGWVREESGPNE